MEQSLALDQSTTVRSKDGNGFLHVASTNITKETVNPYYGREIPGWKEAGLDPNRIYYGYRAGEELAKAASTFDGLPVQSGHHPDSAENPQKEFRVGSVGTGVRWEPPYLVAPLIITDQSAIDDIENGRAREISCAYAYTPDFQHGTHDGISYDFIMREIKGNHVALVEAGRAGPDVIVADAALAADPKTPFRQLAEDFVGILKKWKGAQDSDPEIERKEVELAQAIIDLHKVNPVTGQLEDISEDEDKAAELKAILDKISAKLDPADLELVANGLRKIAGIVPAATDEGGEKVDAVEEVKKEDVVEVKADNEPAAAPAPAPAAKDEEAAYQEAVKAAADACGMDAESEEFQKAFAEGVKYGEAKEKEEPKKLDSEHEREGMEKKLEGLDEEDVKQAMDSVRKEMREHFRKLSIAAEEVRPVLGGVNVMAFDAADDIYGEALKRMGVSVHGHPKAAWRSMFLVATKPQTVSRPMAKDAKLDARFEGLKNIIVG